MAAEDPKADAEVEAETKAEETVEEKAEDTDMKDTGEEKADKKTETETDAPADSRPKVSASSVSINTADSTMNVLASADSSMLMTLTDGGWQYLIAGARSTVGVKAGRYLFEVRIIETHVRPEASGGAARSVPQRQLCRVGVTNGGTSLLLGEADTESACFDCEGFFISKASRKKVCAKYGREVALGLLLNLDPASPNSNTMSLFANGVRACDPQPIPEALLGKPLFPTITFRNVTLQVNFGPAPLVPLPFTCNMIAGAAAADVVVAEPKQPKDGQFEVVFPVGLPEQGYFDWVDSFLEKHPDYVELSDRKILEWCVRSGLTRIKASASSVDKPDLKFNVAGMDDNVVRRVMGHLASTANRNFLVAECKGNLIAGQRETLLKRFSAPKFKKVAAVFVGEPSADFKSKVQELTIKEKKDKLEAERKMRKAAADRLKLLEKRKKEAEMLRKKGKTEEADAEAKEEEQAAKEEAEEEPIVVELTDEEKARWYRKGSTPEVSDIVVSKAYKSFSLPSREEGFDEVRYEWQPEAAAAAALKEWQFERKLTTRVDDIKPGEWFVAESAAWAKQVQEWRKRQGEWKDPAKKKALLEKRAEAKKKAAEEAKEKGLEVEAEAEAEEMEVDTESIDVMNVEDVLDIGRCEPLFANFAFEDWSLLTVRYEVFLLLHAFKKDLDDADRTSFADKDLAFYYQKYFKKMFNIRNFGVENVEGLAALIKDTIAVNSKTSFLEVQLPDDTATAHFVRLAEVHRRDRQRRLDAGDESAELKFPRGSATAPSHPPPQGAGGHGPYAAGVLKPVGGLGPRTVPPSKPGLTKPGVLRPVGPRPGFAHGTIAQSMGKGGAAAGQKRPPGQVPSAWVAKQPRTGAFQFKR